jgi:hypothetical protein
MKLAISDFSRTSSRLNFDLAAIDCICSFEARSYLETDSLERFAFDSAESLFSKIVVGESIC